MNFSIDAGIWFLVVIFITVISFSWIDINMHENEFEEQKKVFFISEMLVSTPGIPENWNFINVEQVGLAGKYNGYYKKCYLSPEKIANLAVMDYIKLTEMLNVENIKISAFGLSIGNSKERAKITRYCDCGGVACEITVEI